MRPLHLLTALMIICSLMGNIAIAQDKKEDVYGEFRKDLQHFVEQLMERTDVVPGISVAVVHEDKVAFAGGFGVINPETKTPMTADTPVYIASATKPFTALALEILDSRGEFELDRSLADATPGLKYAKDIPADKIQLRSMLSHASGHIALGLQMRQAFTGNWDDKLAWHLIAKIIKKPGNEIGQFQYSNSGYNINTTILKHETGLDWQTVVKREVLDPLGMKNTGSDIESALERGITPYGYVRFGLGKGLTKSPATKNNSKMQSAGGLIMSANDAARWLEAQLNDGVVDQKQIFPAKLIKRTHQRIVKTGTTYGPYKREHYGLGWHIGRYDDDVFIHHFGSFSGYAAHTSFMPERRVGVSVLIPEDRLGMMYANWIANFSYNWFNDRKTTLANQEGLIDGIVSAIEAYPAQLDQTRENLENRPYTLTQPVEAYTGKYQSDEFGMIVISNENGVLIADWDGLKTDPSFTTNYTTKDSIRVEFTPWRGQQLEFIMQDGKPTALKAFFGSRFEKIE